MIDNSNGKPTAAQAADKSKVNASLADAVRLLSAGDANDQAMAEIIKAVHVTWSYGHAATSLKDYEAILDHRISFPQRYAPSMN